jgi:hypothetical protein
LPAGRHAFLILAHTQPDLLRVLVDLLDDPGADLFVHVDARSTSLRGLNLQANHSLLTTVSTATAWGGYSLFQAELRLLECAVRTGQYEYLHLISGQDLPLCSVPEMRSRLAGRSEQFIGRVPERDCDAEWKLRYWHPFADSPHYRTSVVRKAARRSAVMVQRAVKVDRVTPRGLQPRHGSQWFSITAPFAAWILDRRVWIDDAFGRSITSDELVLTTMWATLNPPFELSSEEDQNLRWINWDAVSKEGPRVITQRELPQLRRAAERALFARKFDLTADPEAVSAAVSLARST